MSYFVQNTHAIQLSYTVDGTNWSNGMTYNAVEFLCDMWPEVETEGAQSRRNGTGAAKCLKVTPRMKVVLKLSLSNFNPEITSNANVKMKFLQYWMCAAQRQIFYAYGSKHFPGGWDFFDASNNTNYVDVYNVDYQYKNAFESNTTNADGQKIVAVVLECELRVAPSILKWNGTAFV